MAKNYRLNLAGELREVSLDDLGDGRFSATVGDDEHEIELESLDDNTLFRLWVDGRSTPVAIRRNGNALDLFIGPNRYAAEIERTTGSFSSVGPSIAGTVRLPSPMTGQVTEVLVSSGDEVKSGDPLLVIVAMKMNNEIRSPADGMIGEVAVAPGDAVEQGDLLLVIHGGDD